MTNSSSLKKICFILKDFQHGGIPRVTENLQYFLKNQYQFFLFAGNHCGQFKNAFPYCTILKESFLLKLLMLNYRTESDWRLRLAGIAMKTVRHAGIRLFHRDILNWINARAGKYLDSFHFDIICAMQDGMVSEWGKNVHAAHKFVWVHDDYAQREFFNGGGGAFAAYGKILCVSGYTKSAFVKVFPEYAEKTDVLYNLMNVQEIREKASAPVEDRCFRRDCFTIVSVGRLSYQKHFDIIPELAQKIRQQGVAFRWYIIGDGAPASRIPIENAIKQYHLEDQVILLGERKNPYWYEKNADLMVITSRWETFSLVAHESLILGTPVVSYPFSGIEEVLQPEWGGFYDFEQMPEMIVRLVADKEFYQKIKIQTMNYSPDNQAIIEKFNSLCSDVE